MFNKFNVIYGSVPIMIVNMVLIVVHKKNNNNNK